MLTGKKIKLRALELPDLEMLYKWENNTSVWKVSNTITPFSRHVLEQYLLSSHNDIYTTKQLRLVIELNESKIPIGLIDLFDFDAQHLRAGIGILIAEEKERQNGYASEAIDILKNYCFSTLNLKQLYCNVGKENQVSLKFFEKRGFEIAGVKKAWLKNSSGWEDEYFMQLVK